MTRLYVFALCALLTPWNTNAGIITGLYVFGDSLGDTGNAYLAGQTIQTLPISSPGFIPDDPYANRGAELLPALSNGPTWNEQVAETLGVRQDPSRNGGASYAQLGARMTPGVNPDSGEPSVVEQFQNFASQTSGADADSSALYAVWGGANDARDATFAVAGGRPEIATQLISSYGRSLDFVIRGLIGEGARKIIVPNVPSIGFLPAVAEAAALFGQPELIPLANGIASELNDVWALTIRGIEVDLGIDLIELDAFSILADIVASPLDYGLTNVTQGCAFFEACIADSSGFFFWDGLHPTTQGNSLIAAALLAAVPEPNNLGLLLVGAVGFLANRRRTRCTWG